MTITIRCRRCGSIDPNYPATRATGNELCNNCEPREAGIEPEVALNSVPAPAPAGVTLGFTMDDAVSRLDILIEQNVLLNEVMITSSKNRDAQFQELIEKFMPMLEKFAKSLDKPPINPADFTV